MHSWDVSSQVDARASILIDEGNQTLSRAMWPTLSAILISHIYIYIFWRAHLPMSRRIHCHIMGIVASCVLLS